jgi:UDP-glucose 4-epimerase
MQHDTLSSGIDVKSPTQIVVTGGAGFIGTNLLIALRQRYSNAELVSLDIREPAYRLPGVQYRMCDVRDAELVNKQLSGADKVFHLAAIIGTHESFESPYAAFETNVQGTVSVLEAARNQGMEVFIAGMPGIWNNPYSISKDAAVRLARTYYETYHVKVSVLRWYSVYGPYQYVSRYNKAVPNFIMSALREQPLPIYGAGTQVADFLHAQDAAWYAISMLEQQKWGSVVACAGGEGISVNDLAQTIIDISGSKSTVKHLPMRPGEPQGAVVVADTKVLDNMFPDHTRIPLQSGLRDTIKYYRDHPALD